MPPPPKLRNAFGNIRIVEVFRKAKSQHMAHAHSHIGIAGKIEVDLESKGQNSQPDHEDAAVFWKHGMDLRPQSACLIGQKDFFSQAQYKTADACGKLGQAFRPEAKLFGNIPVADNGACDQLGEHGHISAEVYDIILYRSLSAVYINGVGHGLKGVKGDSDGKGQTGERDCAAGEAV